MVACQLSIKQNSLRHRESGRSAEPAAPAIAKCPGTERPLPGLHLFGSSPRFACHGLTGKRLIRGARTIASSVGCRAPGMLLISCAAAAPTRRAYPSPEGTRGIICGENGQFGRPRSCFPCALNYNQLSDITHYSPELGGEPRPPGKCHGAGRRCGFGRERGIVDHISTGTIPFGHGPHVHGNPGADFRCLFALYPDSRDPA